MKVLRPKSIRATESDQTCKVEIKLCCGVRLNLVPVFSSTCELPSSGSRNFAGHPEADTLELLILGRLKGDRRDQTEKHLLDCEVCQQTAQAIFEENAVLIEALKVLQSQEGTSVLN